MGTRLKDLPLRRFTHLTERPRLFWFSINLVVFGLYAALSNPATITGDDASNYWQISKQFTRSGHFSLLTFHQPLRGYSFPLMLNVIRHVGSWTHIGGLPLFRLLAAVEWALLLAVIMPTIFQHILNVRLSLVSIGLFSAISFVFWRGQMLYTLTDFISIFFMASGVLMLDHAASAVSPRRTRIWQAFAAGFALALAANIRPVYQVTLVLGAGFLLWQLARSVRRSPRSLEFIAMFLIGAIVVLTPQSIINKQDLGQISPFANNGHRAGHPSLYTEQLGWGVYMQRYDTIIDPNQLARPAVYLDERGLILSHQKPNLSDPPPPLTLSQYVHLVVRHPRFFVGAYARHFFNGLDTAFSTPYPTHIYPRSAALGFLTFLIMALAFLRVCVALRQSRGRVDARRGYLLAIFVLPALISIPLAVETRFLIPISMLMMGAVLFRPATTTGATRMFPRARYTVPITALALFLSFTLATATFQNVFYVRHATTWCTFDC